MVGVKDHASPYLHAGCEQHYEFDWGCQTSGCIYLCNSKFAKGALNCPVCKSRDLPEEPGIEMNFANAVVMKRNARCELC